MTDIVIKCSWCDGTNCIDCPNFPKRISWSSKNTGLVAADNRSLNHILKLINDYNIQLSYINSYAYLYINGIVLNGCAIHVLDLNEVYHIGKTILYVNKYEEIYKYLDDNGYGQKPMIQLKFVD